MLSVVISLGVLLLIASVQSEGAKRIRLQVEVVNVNGSPLVKAEQWRKREVTLGTAFEPAGIDLVRTDHELPE